jgi:hypothetical protein
MVDIEKIKFKGYTIAVWGIDSKRSWTAVVRDDCEGYVDHFWGDSKRAAIGIAKIYIERIDDRPNAVIKWLT